MGGFVRAVALDLDGTLTENDQPSEAALLEVDRLRDGGLAVLLVTGRIASELDAAFPGLGERFDAVVTENGAVLSVDGNLSDVAEPVEDGLADALGARQIVFRRGRALLAGDAKDAETVISTVGALGLDYQVYLQSRII